MSESEQSTKPVHLQTAAELDRFVADHDTVLLELYTEGCGICASMEPVLGTVARAVDDVAVALVNPRDDPVLIERFDVRSVPTLVCFVDGERVATRADGFQGVDAVVEFVESAREEAGGEAREEVREETGTGDDATGE